MPPATLSAFAALLGGALWIVRALLGGGTDPVLDTLHFVGLACLLVAAAIFGTTLVRSDVAAMRVTVGLASGLLVLSVIEAFRTPDSPWYDGGWGCAAVLVGGIGLLRSRTRGSSAPAAGTHGS